MFEAIKRLIPSEYPSNSWFHQMEVLNKYTPDIRELEKKFAHYLFVFDELQIGHKNAGLIKSAYGDTVASPVASAVFTKPAFTLWKKNLGKESYPIALINKNTNSWQTPINEVPRSIRGELYLIRSEQFLNLDKYKENGVVFERKLVDILIPYTSSRRSKYGSAGFTYQCKTMPCWMYLGVEDYWKNHLDAGFQFTRVKTVEQLLWSDYNAHDFVTFPYYHFTTNEYKI